MSAPLGAAAATRPPEEPVAPQEDFRYGITPTLCTKFTFDIVHEWEKQHATYFVKKWTCANYVKPKISL